RAHGRAEAYAVAEAQEGPGFRPRRDVPHFHLAGLVREKISAGRGQAPAGGTEGQAKDSLGVSAQSERFRAGRDIPNFDRLILAARGEQLAVRTEGNSFHTLLMATEGTGSLVAR